MPVIDVNLTFKLNQMTKLRVYVAIRL